MVRVRFAPSPTGPLHIGGARTALFNYILAKKLGGSFVLRIEDTDLERSTSEFEADILNSLRWLGLDWDEGPEKGGEFAPYRQKERQARHLELAKQLQDQDKAYLDDEGVVRLRYPEEEIVVYDLVCGECVFKPEALGNEPVIVRSDGTPTFHLAVCADDMDMNITHVIRGQDHLTNTAKHVVLFEALGTPLPSFAHLPLIHGEDGSKLSKRNSQGMTTVNDFRAAGYLPEALVNFLVLLGWSHPDEEEQLTMEQAIAAFDIKRVNQTAAKFEFPKLDYLNSWWIKNLPEERVARDARKFASAFEESIAQRGEQYWLEAITKRRHQLTTLVDVAEYAELLFSLNLELDPAAKERFSPPEANEGFQAVVLAWRALLDEHPLEDGRDSYTAEQFKAMLKTLKKSLSVDAKTVFQSLRVALTGSLSGPDLDVLVPLVTRDILRERAESMQQLLAQT